MSGEYAVVSDFFEPGYVATITLLLSRTLALLDLYATNAYNKTINNKLINDKSCINSNVN
jgi:hypothetical protein